MWELNSVNSPERYLLSAEAFQKIRETPEMKENKNRQARYMSK